MQRKKIIKPEKKEEAFEDGRTVIKWRKVGRGSFRLRNGKLIKTNEVFYAAEEDLPKGGMDALVRIDEDGAEIAADKADEAPLKPARSGALFELRMRSVGWYDVVNTATGNPVNDTALRQKDAAELLKQLTNGKDTE